MFTSPTKEVHMDDNLKPANKNVFFNEHDEILTEDQAAQFTKFSPKALSKWRCVGGGPKFIKVSSRAIRYRKSDLTNWLSSLTVSTTSQKI